MVPKDEGSTEPIPRLSVANIRKRIETYKLSHVFSYDSLKNPPLTQQRQKVIFPSGVVNIVSPRSSRPSWRDPSTTLEIRRDEISQPCSK